MSDPGEQIADAVVSYLRAVTTFSLQAEIRKAESPLEELQYEHQQLAVLVYPSSEEAEKAGRGGQCLEGFTVSLLVVRKLTSELTKQRLSEFTREVKTALRGQSQAGYTWSREATTTRADPVQLKELSQFCGVVEITYLKING